MLRTTSRFSRSLYRRSACSRPLVAFTGRDVPNDKKGDHLSSLSHIHAIQLIPTSLQRRFNSTQGGTDDMNSTTFTTSDTATSTADSVDDSISKLFEASQSSIADKPDDAWFIKATEDVGWDPTWYNPADQAVNIINFLHDMTGLEYGLTIFATVGIIRTMLLPLYIRSRKTMSRMAHLQPELKALQDRYEALGSNVTKQEKLNFSRNMKAIFAKYQVKPVQAMMMPFLQAPIFMSMFFGLRKMPDYFHDELAKGGMLWFPDLTVPDPIFVLPVASALTFLAMIEFTKHEQMATNPKQAATMINFMRIMGVMVIPISVQFPAGVLCYWVSNNTFTMLQTIAFTRPGVKKYFDIWEPPKPIPGSEPESISDAFAKVVKKIQGRATTDAEIMKRHNEQIENQKKVARVSRDVRARRRQQQQQGAGKRRR